MGVATTYMGVYVKRQLPTQTMKDKPMTDVRPLAAPVEVAEFLGVSPNALAKMRMTGNGPEFLRVNARTIRYRWEAVESWLNGQTHTTTDDYAA